MPIVETPSDAIACFVATRIDDLIIGNIHVPAPDYSSMCPIRNELEINFTGKWEGEQAIVDAQNSLIWATPFDGRDPTLLTKIQWKILNHIEPEKPSRMLSIEIGISIEELVDELLFLYRGGIIRWNDLPSLPITDQGSRQFNIQNQ